MSTGKRILVHRANSGPSMLVSAGGLHGSENKRTLRVCVLLCYVRILVDRGT